VLCKHEVTGSIPVSSTKIEGVLLKGKLIRSSPPKPGSQILMHCFWFAAIRRQRDFLLFESMAPTQRQAIQPFGAGIGRFQEPQGSAASQKKEGATMFDNEIDWVTRLEQWRVRREAYEPQLTPSVLKIQGRAHAS
jgi:hypothetical protein